MNDDHTLADMPLDGADPALDALAWRQVLGTGFNAYIGPIMFAPEGPSEAEATRWYARLPLDHRHINIGGVCHGGVLMSLADIAMGTAAYVSGARHPCATIEMNAHFLAGAKEDQTVLAAVERMRAVRGLSFMACRLASGGRLVMRASGIWKHLDSRGPGQSGRATPPPAPRPGP